MNVGLKLSHGYCLLGGLWKLKLQVGLCLGQVEQCPGKAEHCPVGPDIVRWEVSRNVIFSQNLSLSSPT
jgi:hypothetical protein